MFIFLNRTPCIINSKEQRNLKIFSHVVFCAIFPKTKLRWLCIYLADYPSIDQIPTSWEKLKCCSKIHVALATTMMQSLVKSSLLEPSNHSLYVVYVNENAHNKFLSSKTKHHCIFFVRGPLHYCWDVFFHYWCLMIQWTNQMSYTNPKLLKSLRLTHYNSVLHQNFSKKLKFQLFYREQKHMSGTKLSKNDQESFEYTSRSERPSTSSTDKNTNVKELLVKNCYASPILVHMLGLKHVNVLFV